MNLAPERPNVVSKVMTLARQRDEADEAARRTPPTATMIVSGGDPGGYAYLRLTERLQSRRAPSCDPAARHQLRPRVGPLHAPETQQPCRARPRAERRHGPSGPPLGAVPAARHISVSRSVRRAAERRGATSLPAASRVRASARCTLPRRPQPRRPRLRSDRCCCPPRPPPGVIRGSIRIYGSRRAVCAAAH